MGSSILHPYKLQEGNMFFPELIPDSPLEKEDILLSPIPIPEHSNYHRMRDYINWDSTSEL